jgi:hypothetical protein
MKHRVRDRRGNPHHPQFPHAFDAEGVKDAASSSTNSVSMAWMSALTGTW